MVVGGRQYQKPRLSQNLVLYIKPNRLSMQMSSSVLLHEIREDEKQDMGPQFAAADPPPSMLKSWLAFVACSGAL